MEHRVELAGPCPCGGAFRVYFGVDGAARLGGREVTLVWVPGRALPPCGKGGGGRGPKWDPEAVSLGLAEGDVCKAWMEAWMDRTC